MSITIGTTGAASILIFHDTLSKFNRGTYVTATIALARQGVRVHRRRALPLRTSP